MKITHDLADAAVLTELGDRLAHRRIETGLTQARLAEESGVAKRTVERLEAGASVQLTSLVRVLRTLDLLGGLEALLPPATPGPIELLKRGKVRQRVKTGRGKSEGEWQWDDES